MNDDDNGVREMFHLKHIQPSGHEVLMSAVQVTFEPDTGAGYETVWRHDESGQAHPLTGGAVYVMNDAGNTVARYYLTAPTPAQPSGT